MAPPPALWDEILEEILFRLPPDDPARLVHAALVCRAWCRLVADRGFRRRYREFHGTAPMLGFFRNPSRMPLFVPTSSFRPRYADLPNWVVMDVRHGRLLRLSVESGLDVEHLDFEVWDPITGKRTALPRLTRRKGHLGWEFIWNAAVLCAASKSGACDHLDCHGGPTLAVFAVGSGFNLGQVSVRVYLYSSDDGSWSEPVSEPVHAAVHSFSGSMIPSALAGKLIYFAFPTSKTILKYNLETQETSDVHRPPQFFRRLALMTTEDGQLQLATVNDFRLYLWSREDGHEGDAGWAQNRVVDLKKLIPASALETSPFVVGASNGIDVVFLQTCDGLFTVDLKSDLKSEQATKVRMGDFSDGILPYMSFYTPAFDLASENEGASVSASNA